MELYDHKFAENPAVLQLMACLKSFSIQVSSFSSCSDELYENLLLSAIIIIANVQLQEIMNYSRLDLLQKSKLWLGALKRRCTCKHEIRILAQVQLHPSKCKFGKLGDLL